MADNELIAEFMGWSISNIDEFGRESPYKFAKKEIQYKMVDVCDLKFRTSWDWLMPVVEKIGEIGYQTTLYTDHQPSLNGHEFSIYDTGHTVDIGDTSKDLITCIYATVVEFIKWYNTQPK